MTDITRLIEAVHAGEASATKDLLPVIYQDLKRIASAKLSREASHHTLQPTALVHEAYVRLVSSKSDSWQNRAHFFGAAAEAMRRILIDHARKKKRQKRGGKYERLEFREDLAVDNTRTEELLALDEALKELELLDKQKADLVKLKFFAGMTLKEAAELLEIPTRTADRYWAYARAWLQRHVSEQKE